MNKTIYHLESILKMNSLLFINALDGVTEEQAKERISDHNNPLIWIAGHTVWARYNICGLLGKPEKNPYADMFGNGKPFDPSHNYPSLAEIKMEWNKATDLLTDALASVTEEHLAAESPFKSPIGDFSFGGAVAFLVQHESYEIGMIAF